MQAADRDDIDAMLALAKAYHEGWDGVVEVYVSTLRDLLMTIVTIRKRWNLHSVLLKPMTDAESTT